MLRVAPTPTAAAGEQGWEQHQACFEPQGTALGAAGLGMCYVVEQGGFGKPTQISDVWCPCICVHRWTATAMPHSSAFVGHQGMQPPIMMQPGPCPPRQQLQAVHMQQQTYTGADSLADHLATQCHIAAAPGRGGHMLGRSSGGMAVAGPGLPVAVSTAAFPPPGLTMLQSSQPGLLQPHSSSMLQQPMSSTPQGGVVICGALSPSMLPAMAQLQLMPAARQGVQGMMMPAAAVSDRLAPSACIPYMQMPSPGPYLAGQGMHMQAPSGYMQHPGMPGCPVPQVRLPARSAAACQHRA